MSSEGKRWRLVCYDIREPKRYRKAYKIIRGHGRRLQYSVFRCRLTDIEVEKLRWRLSQVLVAEDSLLIIDLCPRCASRAISKNHVDEWDVEPKHFRVVDRTDNQALEPGGRWPTLRRREVE